MEINTLVEKCIKSSIEYGAAAFEVVENSRKTNRLYDNNFKNFKTLKSLGKKGIDEIEKLLEYPNDYVKYCSAVHFLSVKEEKAKIVLKQLIDKTQTFGFSVKMLIKEWDKGNLKDYLS